MFADIIRKERLNKQLSQKELGDIIGVTQQAIGRWEKNLTNPDTATLHKLADFLNVSTDYLLGRTNIRKQIPTEAAHRSDNPMDNLPQEAIDKIEEFKELMRMKYGKKSSK